MVIFSSESFSFAELFLSLLISLLSSFLFSLFPLFPLFSLSEISSSAADDELFLWEISRGTDRYREKRFAKMPVLQNRCENYSKRVLDYFNIMK